MDPLRNEGVSEVHALPRSESELQRKKTEKKEKKNWRLSKFHAHQFTDGRPSFPATVNRNSLITLAAVSATPKCLFARPEIAKYVEIG